MKISGYSLIMILVLINLSFELFADNVENKPPVGIEERLGNYLPLNLKFYNSTGDTLALEEIINQSTILSLIFYNCAGVCSPMMNALVDAMNYVQLEPNKDFKVISLSFDHNENIEDAAKWKKSYLAQMTRKIPEDSWYFMVGDSLSIRQLTDAVGFYFKEDGFNSFIHAGAIYAISPNGMISRYLFFDKHFNPFDIKMALIEASEGKTNPTISKVLQFCFSYDPNAKTYVFNFTKVIGSVMLLSAITFFIVLVIKGRKKQDVNLNEDNDE